MPLTDRIRSAFSMSQLPSSISSSSSSEVDDGLYVSPTTPSIKSRQRTLTGNSGSSSGSIIVVPVLRLKKTFTDLRGAVKRRKEERHREAVALWAAADEREWEYPTWGGPAKKSRKFSREQRDSLRSWGWSQDQSNGTFAFRPRHSSVYGSVSPCTSLQNSFRHTSLSLNHPFNGAGRQESPLKQTDGVDATA